jgi:HK97 gp10 family phage protein
MNGVFYPSNQKKPARPKNHNVHLLQGVRLDTKPVPKSLQENNPRVHRDLQCHARDGEGRTGKSAEGGKKTSVEVTCDVEGIEEFKAAMQHFDSSVQRQVHRFLASWCADVKAKARRDVHVVSGRLRSSIYAKISEWVAEIGAEATYAAFVEFGTRFMAARPYLYPAIQAYLPRLERVICEAIDAAKSEAGLS